MPCDDVLLDLTGTTPEAISFFHSCGLDPAWLQPSVQSERKEINGTPTWPSLAKSSLTFSWMSHNTPLACYPFRIFDVSKLCHLLLRSTTFAMAKKIKIKNKNVERWSSEVKGSEEYSGRTNGRCRFPDCQPTEHFCRALFSSGPNAPSC